jgi:hypothetical protein
MILQLQNKVKKMGREPGNYLYIVNQESKKKNKMAKKKSAVYH